ncbi:MAG TPA: DUF924 family protein [Nevskiaceae bacterium]|nr:DUF924 family protein [Nevskiaceae bacterium]
MTPSDVLAFWFGRSSDDAVVATEQGELWFGGDAATDALIREHYGELREQAIAGQLHEWESSAEGLLALVILVDQFSRNIHRGTAAAFAHDAMARSWARRMVANGGYARLRPIQRLFVALPLEHSEALADQQQGVALLEQLARQVPPELREKFDSYADYARRHRDIIARFGHFPHRNRILGRDSTHEEIEFLKQPGSSF